MELSDEVNGVTKTRYLSDITTIEAKYNTEIGGLLFVVTYDRRSLVWRRFEWDPIG